MKNRRHQDLGVKKKRSAVIDIVEIYIIIIVDKGTR